MKKFAKCPKCGSEKILVFESKSNKKDFSDSEIIGRLGKRIYTTRYVCSDCGYTERYFDGENLEKLKKKFNKMKD